MCVSPRWLVNGNSTPWIICHTCHSEPSTQTQIKMANLLLSLVTLLEYCAPSINSEDLSVLDSSLKRKLSPLHEYIKMYRSSRFSNIRRPASHSAYRISGRKQRTVSCGEKTAFKRFHLPS